MQKFLSLIRSLLFIFVFIFTTLGGGSKKILLQFMSKSVLPVFSSKSFIVPSLTFRSLIQLKFLCMVLEKEMATHSCILAGESHGQRSLADYSP